MSNKEILDDEDLLKQVKKENKQIVELMNSIKNKHKSNPEKYLI